MTHPRYNKKTIKIISKYAKYSSVLIKLNVLKDKENIQASWHKMCKYVLLGTYVLFLVSLKLHGWTSTIPQIG